MPLNPSSPVTGAAITGFTSPTYTFTEDVPPNAFTRRFVFTQLGGTQTGVETHSVSSPFYIDVSRPAQMKSLPRLDARTGLYPNIPVNEYHIKLVKGATVVASGGASTEVVVVADLKYRQPAGVELTGNDPEEISAVWSCLAGFISANAQGLKDMVVTGMLK